MAAGCVVLGELYTAGRRRGAHRARRAVPRARSPTCSGATRSRSAVTGYGSMLLRSPRASDRRELQELLFLGLYLRGDLHGAARDGQPEPAADRRPARQAALAALDDTLAELAQSSPSQ